jgi:2-enoate reductase
MLTNSTVCEVTDDAVTYKDKDGNLVSIPADTVVVAAGYKANNPLEAQLKDSGIEIKVVGDAVKARKVLEATREGYDAGKAL